MSEVSDVKVIKTENGPVRINATDFKEGEHELHVADETHDEHGILRPVHVETEPPRRSKAATDVSSDTGNDGDATNIKTARNFDQFGVMQNRNKFFIVDGANAGKVVDDVEGIDPKGYASNADAWNVLLTFKAGKPATENA